MSPTITCPITDSLVNQTTHNEKYFEYELIYNDYKYSLRLDSEVNWEADETIDLNQKTVLRSLLFNNEWPVESEFVLTKNLISQIMRLGEFPRNFDDKYLYLLVKLFLQGGKEYEAISIDVRKHYNAYCASWDEYDRLFKGLTSKGLIVIDDQRVNLTEQGIQRAQQQIERQVQNAPVEYLPYQGPTINIVSVKDDESSAEKLKKLLNLYGITTSLFNGINDNGVHFKYNNFRSTLYSEKSDYVIFIKSFDSDKNVSFGSLIDISIEAHQVTSNRNHSLIYFACVDDARIEARPRTVDYHPMHFDFRITTNRHRLLQAINNDWEKRNREKEKYRLPQYRISNDEKRWLRAIYDQFLKNENFQVDHLLAKLWDDLEDNNFHPSAISPVLARAGSDITLLGINSIDPGSRLVHFFEEVVSVIRDILKDQGKVERVSSDEIINKIPDLSQEEVLQMFRLLNTMGLSIGFASGEDTSSVTINQDVYQSYRNFRTLEGFVNDFVRKYSQNEETETQTVPPFLTDNIDPAQIDSYKTHVKIRDTSSIEPVMGVNELADNIAEIIHNLPSEQEKGQMIGIFGKWGRGKSFLCKELWKILEKKQDIQYTRVEFHAWKYQETPASWAYLYENFVDTFLSSRRSKRLGMLRLNRARFGIWPMIKNITLLVLSVVIGICASKWLEWYGAVTVMSVEIGVIISVLQKLNKPFSVKALDLIKAYGIRNSYKENLGLQAEIQKELITLLKTWIPEKSVGQKKILLFVEDIDRCSEERIIQNMDALRVLMEEEEIARRVIIVAAIDERVLKNAIRIKYSHMPIDTFDMKLLVSEYLDKLFILAVKLGVLSNQQKQEFVHALIAKEMDKEEFAKYRSSQASTEEQKQMQQTGMSAVMKEETVNSPLWKEMTDLQNGVGKVQRQNNSAIEPLIEDGDFVVSNGDLAIKNTVGTTLNLAELQKLANDRIETQNEYKILSPIEVEAFEMIVAEMANATPRKIRIFYYRYLLSKNLIMNQYTQARIVNIWQSKQSVHVLMKTLLEYCDNHDPESISLDKENIFASLGTNRDVSNIIGEQFIISHEDFKIVSDVMELVIAY